jgi:putative RNA 2'-phosphotransferase
MKPNVRLSKFMSLVLRHEPASVGLTLDTEGFVPLGALLAAVVKTTGFQNTTEADIRDVIATGSKPRFEIVGDRIRARWGHSTEERIEHTPVEPPAVLFHGTAPRALDAIGKDGLVAMSRQYVHLSPDRETAILVGKRHDPEPVIINVQAKAAHDAGIVFYRPDPGIWLAHSIPPGYLKW